MPYSTTKPFHFRYAGSPREIIEEDKGQLELDDIDMDIVKDDSFHKMATEYVDNLFQRVRTS